MMAKNPVVDLVGGGIRLGPPEGADVSDAKFPNAGKG
jgi:hypothetical protein